MREYNLFIHIACTVNSLKILHTYSKVQNNSVISGSLPWCHDSLQAYSVISIFSGSVSDLEVTCAPYATLLV